jgi:hypothetical protein
MKVTRVTSLFLQLDELHKRIDLHRLVAHLLSIAGAAWWALLDYSDTRDLFVRLLAAALFITLGRLLLVRLGTSRVASLAMVATAFVLCASFTAREFMVLNVYILVLLLAQEYFIVRTKLVSLISALLVGILAVGVGEHADVVLVLFVTVILFRALWHAVLERLSKKPFVLFAVKAAAMAVLAPAVYLGLREIWSHSSTLPSHVPTPDVPTWLLVVIGLLVIRGLWATFLLKTDRSPAERGLRVFYAVFGAALLFVVMLLDKYGKDVFLPNALEKLASFGLTDYSLAIGSFALLAVGLFVTAGIDRTLYKDTRLARAVQRAL